jgi:hypothetical protein
MSNREFLVIRYGFYGVFGKNMTYTPLLLANIIFLMIRFYESSSKFEFHFTQPATNISQEKPFFSKSKKLTFANYHCNKSQKAGAM